MVEEKLKQSTFLLLRMFQFKTRAVEESKLEMKLQYYLLLHSNYIVSHIVN